jgi:pSer/pThr/pTyr-binding forkhead associated (FHA) protein
MARLVIFDKTVRGVDLPRSAVVLGRSKTADIPIHDEILSRKHCSIRPTSTGHELVDLESAHGTFLNGARVQRSDLKPDDVIEIGNTVIVLLDTDTWERGEGLTRLRNPLKAQELVQTLRRKGAAVDAGAPPRSRSPARSRRTGRKAQRPARGRAPETDWAAVLLGSGPRAAELLEAYALHLLVSVAARRSPQLRALLGRVLERLIAAEPLTAPSLAGDGLDRLQAMVKQIVRDELAANGGSAAEPGAAT